MLRSSPMRASLRRTQRTLPRTWMRLSRSLARFHTTASTFQSAPQCLAASTRLASMARLPSTLFPALMPMCSSSLRRTTTSLARPTRTALRQVKATSALRARATARLRRSTRVPTPSTRRTLRKRMPRSVEPFRAVGLNPARAVGMACARWGPSAPPLRRVEPERTRETAAPSDAGPDARSRQAKGEGLAFNATSAATRTGTHCTRGSDRRAPAHAYGPSSFWPSSHTSGAPPRLVTLNSSRHRSRSSMPSPMSRPAPASMRASTSATRP